MQCSPLTLHSGGCEQVSGGWLEEVCSQPGGNLWCSRPTQVYTHTALADPSGEARTAAYGCVPPAQSVIYARTTGTTTSNSVSLFIQCTWHYACGIHSTLLTTLQDWQLLLADIMNCSWIYIWSIAMSLNVALHPRVLDCKRCIRTHPGGLQVPIGLTTLPQTCEYTHLCLPL